MHSPNAIVVSRRRMFTLRSSLLRELIRSKMGGYDALARSWPSSCRVPDSTTVWRWLSGKSHLSSSNILPLAGALDLDPFALFDVTPTAFSALCQLFSRNIGGSHRGGLASDLRWMPELIAPRAEWPPQSMADQFFRRPWQVRSFRHTGKGNQNFFQNVRITASSDETTIPKVWHFAFKRADPAFPLWVPYGFVERYSNQVTMYHYRGSCQTVSASGHKSFLVETWFGLDAADFRVASVHGFTIELSEAKETNLPSIRFP